MGRRSPYPEEFRKDAVALFRAAAGKWTYAAVAADLGITAESLRTWVRKDEARAVPGRSDTGGEAEEVARLRARGRRINRKRVIRLMRVNYIVGRHLRKKRRTTIADKAAPPVPDLVMRDFTADTLNTRWCGDITYVAVGTTWLYLATVIDICSRRVVGWSIGDHMRTSLVTDAIEMAVAARGGQVNGVVFHTDRGAQYSATAFADVCRRHGIRRSMGRVGSSYDNALAESFFQSLKRELLHGRRWTSKAQTRLELFRWLSYCNRRRRHSALAYLTPTEFEQRLITSRTLSLAA
ncbi:IS3 family transposase [Streptomyces sp. NPDC001665]